MKKLILLMALIFAAVSASGQGRYYTLKECGNDPLKYIEKNYQDNASRHIGRTVGAFVKECELKLEDFVPGEFRVYEGGSDPREGKIVDIIFFFYHEEYRYTVRLAFRPPYPYTMDDFYKLENSEYDETWKDIYYTFFMGYKIEDIRVNKQKNREHLPRSYRRP